MKLTTIALAAASLAAAFTTAMTVTTGAQAKSRDVSIASATRYYTITGNSAADFANAMSQRGPYSGQHRRRVWATAARTMRYQIERRRKGGRCRITRAKVWMKIDYTMPKLRKRGVRASARRSWQQMYKILNTHERVHGRYYQQLARDTHASLRRLRPMRSCRSLDAAAAKLVRRLSAKNQAINDRFDRTDQRNYRRMERIYSMR